MKQVMTAIAIVTGFACAGDPHWLDDQTCFGTESSPPWLSETGCFEGDALTPVSTLVSYEIQVPLWSDGADKRHYVTLPKDTFLELDGDGTLLLPPGGVFIKEFVVGGRRVETRFVTRDLQGDWHFATYVWEEGATDAYLLEDGIELAVGDDAWEVPSARDCTTCHVDETSLGFTVPQLERQALNPFTGVESNQLETFADIAWIRATDEERIAAREASPLSASTSEDSLDSRARSYLHANCAFCHGASDVATFDLHYDVALADTGVCNTRPEFGDFFVEGARLLVPGDPEASLILLRMETEMSSWRMPTLGTAHADPVGVELVRDWIAEVDCL